MGYRMKISVAIPSYGRPKYLLQTINEVLNQKHPDVIEILVTDQSPSEIYTEEQWQTMKNWIDSQTIIYQHFDQPNANAARNRCIAKATGDIILLLDDDVLLPNNFIAEHYKCYQENFQNRKVIAVAGKNFHRTKVQDRVLDHINLTNYELHTSPDFKDYTNGIQSIAKYDTLVGCNMSFLKSAALDIRGFDENFSSYYDEADFCFRLKKRMNKEHQVIIVNPDAYLIHLRAFGGGHELRSGNSNREFGTILSYNLFAIRHLPVSKAFVKVFHNFRMGPLRKYNVMNVSRFFSALYFYFVSIIQSFRLRNKIKSSL